MSDKSSAYNVLTEGMPFLDKSIPSLSTACLKFSKFFMWPLKPRVSFSINSAQLCNNLART